jgi:hypothetical protein
MSVILATLIAEWSFNGITLSCISRITRAMCGVSAMLYRFLSIRAYCFILPPVFSGWQFQRPLPHHYGQSSRIANRFSSLVRDSVNMFPSYQFISQYALLDISMDRVSQHLCVIMLASDVWDLHSSSFADIPFQITFSNCKR